MSNNYPARRVERIAAPAVEPVSVSDAKLFLRIDSADEDTLISDMIAAARIAAEEQTGRSLITQSWRVSYDGYAPAEVHLPHGDVQSVTSVKIVAQDGGETLVESASYHLNAVQELVFDAAVSGHRVVIEYVAGYGDLVADIPADIVQAILLHVAYLYEHRDSILPPASAKLCYDYYREVRL